MAKIMLLDQSTINKIAAGEVVERPSAVVKELVENSIDSGANAVTVEIKDGGTSLIRITDNGCGIEKEQIAAAFERHATSKIRSVEDLLMVSSLGFRGEALASVAAVSKVEVITKTPEELTGIRYIIEGGNEKSTEEIGCPEGTTFLVRNLFFNTPARKKFLKSNTTEAGYISSLLERLCVSHPNISFKFINNGQMKLHTTGNGNMKDILYQLYGKEITRELIPVEKDEGVVSITGFIANPVVSRANKNYMNYFVNGRYVKSSVIHKAIEEAYKPYSMTHRYPFTSLLLEIAPEWIDVNVHPTKMEVRFHDSQVIYELVYAALREVLAQKELIPDVGIDGEMEKPEEKSKEISENVPEPFEKKRLVHYNNSSGQMPNVVREDYGGIRRFTEPVKSFEKYGVPKDTDLCPEIPNEPMAAGKAGNKHDMISEVESGNEMNVKRDVFQNVEEKPVQLELFHDTLLSRQSRKKHRIIGQVFKTYWIIEFEDKMYLIDQHAAHEKVLYERNLKKIQEKPGDSQLLNPPIIVSLAMNEEAVLKEYQDKFKQIGFEIEPFGGKEYAIYGVPADMLGLAEKDIFLEMLDSLMEEKSDSPIEMVLEKAASMSCKAAVKGNQELSFAEAEALIDDLLTLENPYNCPHGRPVIVSMSKYEIEKKFKRIV